MTAEARVPRVSVVVEGYNETLSLGSVAATLEALGRQDFPLDQVEVILAGSSAQAEAWREICAEPKPFFAVKSVGRSGAHYYELKNLGAELAAGEIIAHTDSDASPEPGWLSALVAGISAGEDVAAGVTLFRDESGRGPEHPLMQVAAAISWGFVVGRALGENGPRPRGFLSHNVGFRAETLRRHPYRTDLGRTCAGSFLYQELVRSGVRIGLQEDQRVAHGFSLGWWVWRLHRRFGYEVFQLRRLDPSDPKRWLTAFWPIEPLCTMLWHMLLDIPQWWRFGRLLRLSRRRRLALLPLVVGMSFLARGGEMLGMYQTIVAPGAMKRFAESN